MVYNSQRGRGFNDIFGTLNRTFKPVIEGAADVGANLATGLVGELLSGKSPKASDKGFKVEAEQNVNEAVQNPRKNVNNREDVFFLPRFIIPAGIILATI